MLQSENIAAFLNSLGLFALPMSLVISIIIAIAGVLPSIVVTSANVLLFGPGYGFLISWLGEILGAVTSFYLYRIGFKKPFQNLTGNYPRINKIVEYDGKKIGLLLFQARLFPFLPSGIVTFAGAVSKVDVKTFFWSTALGKIPSLLLETFISFDLINIDQNWLRLSLTLVALSGLFYIFKNKKL
ncbi:MAG: VTT domain-containing protein [Dehalobacterium sp.]